MENDTDSAPLRKELVRIWWLYFLCGLPVWFITEWAWSGLSWSSFDRFGWGRFLTFSLIYPTVVVLSLWRKRRRRGRQNYSPGEAQAPDPE